MIELRYPAKIWRDEEGYFQVRFPDLPGAISYGDSLDHAKEMARECLSVMLDGMLDSGLEIPSPRIEKGKNIYLIEPAPNIAAPILLRRAREEAQMTLVELASRLGVTYQSVQRLERSGANPSLRTLAKVARALGRELHIAL